LGEVPRAAEELDLTAAATAVGAWNVEAEALHRRIDGTLTSGKALPASSFAALNDALLRVERELLIADGIPGRPWFKHCLYAPRYTYAAMSLPGVREAAESDNWAEARRQLEVLIQRLRAVTEATRHAASLVPGP
jgi:N-acetylated-alpha-linked acidic dipeptidase